MHPEFWRDKSAFVTGHTGFKGGWLSLWLQRLGARVTGYALAPPTTPNLFTAAGVGDTMRSLEGDVRDLEALIGAMQEAAPDVVFHLAAQPIVRTSYEEPVDTFSTNVMGTCHVLEGLRRCPSVRAAIIVTSDKCYENTERREPHVESNAMGGHDPYSSSKGCAELVTAAFRRSFFTAEHAAERPVAVASVRAGNVIGGGDWAPHRLVPDIVRALGRGAPVEVRSPAAIRPWQHVVNPVSGYLLLAERLWHDGQTYAGSWNFGPEDEDCQPVSWLVERIVDRWGDDASWQAHPQSHPHEAGFLMLDCSKARSELGWRPVVGVGRAVDWLVEWYRAHAAGGDVRELTLARIEEAERELVAAVQKVSAAGTVVA